MKLSFMFFAGVVLSITALGQIPADVTPELQKKLKLEIEKEIPKLKQELEEKEINSAQIEFTLDTFRIEQLMEKWIDLDYSDFGMRDAGYAATKLYDSLLNKYYKKLLAVLQNNDKQVLIQAQKAWLSFRDNETKLTETISKEEYTGGGTMQNIVESVKYLTLVKSRTIAIFEHYTRATQNY